MLSILHVHCALRIKVSSVTSQQALHVTLSEVLHYTYNIIVYNNYSQQEYSLIALTLLVMLS